MPGEYTNVYQKARLDAGLTQEQAAEALDFSVESVKAYETGLRAPPDARVAAMAEVYRAPWLRLAHARATDALGVLPREDVPPILSRVTVQLVRILLEWSEEHAGLRLLQIAEDDRIDESERSDFDAICCRLEGISAAWLALRHLPPGRKGDRPELAGSKRSERSIKLRSTEDHISIIPDRAKMSRKITAGKAVSLT